MRTFIFLVLASLWCTCGICYSQERYFYHELPYGSEASYNPWNLILNGSYDVLQFDNMPRNLGWYPYRHASKVVLRNLSAPLPAISHFGWRNFLQQEVLLFNFSPKKSQGWPNYNLHLIGGGMTFAAMTEWYDVHGIVYPELMSLATVAAEHFLNEVVENGPLTGENVDPIADIYLFDLGGILLFSNDRVKEFFGRTLTMRDWSLQPMFAAKDGTLQNNGQYFSMKWKWFGNERWSAFYYFGLEGLVGASYRFAKEESFSTGVGFRGRKRILIDETSNRYAVDLSWNLGFFYDRNSSLLASLFVSNTLNDVLTMNLYPGTFTLFGLTPGAAVTFDRHFHPSFGITFSSIPGVALIQ